ncbi:TPA: hypothetical protein QH056_001821 [Klebsiella oxytoca]|nr:hypothetical protein [Klebsiella oxytoca]
MAVQDYFNNSVGLPTHQDYQPNQFNSKGESLSPTPTGAPITVDVDNDNRNGLLLKQQALQATQDTLSVYDTSNKIVGSTGYLYEKIDDSRPTQARNAAMAFAEGYFSHMGDQGQAIAAGALGASQSVSNINGSIKRQSLIPYLESKEYNPIDIDKWIKTGDTKDLIVNKGKYEYDPESGTVWNPLTGNVRYIGVSGAVQQRLDTNRMNADTQMQEMQYNTKKPLAVIPEGNTAIMPDSSVVTTQPKVGGGVGGSTVNYNEQLGSYGYNTTLPSGEHAFVHTSNRGVESKSGSNIIYDIIDDNGNRIRTETGPALSQGASGRNLAIMGSSTEALNTASSLANMHYNTSNTAVGPVIEDSKRFLNSRDQNDFESTNKQLSTQVDTVLADRAVQSTTPRAVLQADMKIQTQQGGKISVYKSDKENQRTLNQQLDILAGAQVAAEYNDTHGGRSMPLDQYDAARKQRLQEILSEHPEYLNAFGQEPGSKNYTDPTPYIQNTNQLPVSQAPTQQPQTVQNGMNRTRRGTVYEVKINP